MDEIPWAQSCHPSTEPAEDPGIPNHSLVLSLSWCQSFVIDSGGYCQLIMYGHEHNQIWVSGSIRGMQNGRLNGYKHSSVSTLPPL